jgi:hypothetical protein
VEERRFSAALTTQIRNAAQPLRDAPQMRIGDFDDATNAAVILSKACGFAF